MERRDLSDEADRPVGSQFGHIDHLGPRGQAADRERDTGIDEWKHLPILAQHGLPDAPRPRYRDQNDGLPSRSCQERNVHQSHSLASVGGQRPHY